jgi:hypothetical protein
MLDYTIERVGESVIVLAAGRPQLEFVSLAAAQAVIAGVAALDDMPRFLWPDDKASACETLSGEAIQVKMTNYGACRILNQRHIIQDEGLSTTRRTPATQGANVAAPRVHFRASAERA